MKLHNAASYGTNTIVATPRHCPPQAAEPEQALGDPNTFSKHAKFLLCAPFFKAACVAIKLAPSPQLPLTWLPNVLST